METQTTDRLKLAAHFVNSTNSPIFLTGKAGTGKTTFLRNLASLTHKAHVIVAPTGIAALHAKGVTIHSQFLFPMGSFLPTREPEGNFASGGGFFFTQYTLNRKHPLNMSRKKVLRAIDLLIIDEVSMLRADLLDAIDHRLRTVKGNFSEPFGGVQVLMIGDLFQLPPIVKDHEWQALGRYYKSMHFFEAHALKQSGMVYLELDRIFRQSDDRFIDLLNHLRENRATAEDIAFLNSFYKTPDQIKDLKETIIITTHNYKAEEQNRKELAALKGPSHFFEAIVEKDFPENLYPLPHTLELKEGAQIMFVRNDSSGLSDFFNGKMAKVKTIDEDGICVVMADSEKEYLLKRETWENKKYVVDEATKELTEEVVGTFEQYPVKLAWAVTVHKSQGLTFDKAIIDVGQAFAPGQVYVALSRLRSLDGLALRTRIQPAIINNDPEVVAYVQKNQSQEPLEDLLQVHQKKYLEKLLVHTFDFRELLQAFKTFATQTQKSLEFEDAEMQQAVQLIEAQIIQENDNTLKFQRQLLQLLASGDEDRLLGRLEKGSNYYSALLEDGLKKLLIHVAEVEQFSRTKSYLEGLSELELVLVKKIMEVGRVTLLVPSIISGRDVQKMDELSQKIIRLRSDLWEEAKEAAKNHPKFVSTKTGRKRKEKGVPGIKLAKGETYEITYSLSGEGMKVQEIAAARGLAESTIKSHLARGIAEGKVSIHQHLDKQLIDEITGLIRSTEGNLASIREAHAGKYDYGTLKMVSAYLSVEED